MGLPGLSLAIDDQHFYLKFFFNDKEIFICPLTDSLCSVEKLSNENMRLLKNANDYFLVDVSNIK